MNEAGEPYMTAAELRFEAALDEQYAYERAMDPDAYYGDYDYDPEDVDPEDCDHGDASCGRDGQWVCDICYTEIPEPSWD